MFYAQNFIYDGVPGSEFGLRISSLSEQSVADGASVSLITQDIYRRPSVYLLGVKETPVLNIPISITVEKELSAQQASAISKWLFGQQTYKKLQILQPDMEDVYYNCIITKPVPIKVGNIIRGFTATAECDSPFAWEYDEKFFFKFDNYMVNQHMTIDNPSDSSDYLYPKLVVAANIFGGSFEILNRSDNYRTFGIDGMNLNEKILVNNNTQQIVSANTGEQKVNLLKNYNYKWFRLVPGRNYLTIKGNIKELGIILKAPKKIT